MKEDKNGYKSTLKSEDTEELIDILFYRRIGYLWAILFKKLRITPNQVTIASIFIGVAAGICFYPLNLTINIIGILLLIWANTFDSADGQLSRMTNQKSELGRILDGVCGNFWFISIYLAIIFRLWPQWNFWILLLAIAAGYSHSKQTALADYFRNIHLLFLKGKNGSELDNSILVKEKYEKLNWRKEPFIKFFELMYFYYTKGQEKWTPKTQQLFRTINTKYNGNAPESFRKLYREKSKPLLKYTNMLSFNLRATVLFICILINIPWIYFIFEITIMNFILFYMLSKYEKLSIINSQLSIIKGIIFDYGGTIDTNGKHWGAVLWDAYKSNDVPVTEEQFREAYVYAERYLAVHPVIQSDFNFKDVLLAKTKLQIDWLEEKGFLTKNNKFSQYPIAISNQCYTFVRAVLEKSVPVIQSLSDKYPLVLVSNFYGNIEVVLKDFNLDMYFDKIIESSVVKIRKPDPAIFELGIKALNFAPEEIAVIGDSFEKDIVPASKAGCRTIWLKGTGWNEEVEKTGLADIVITDFEELKSVF